MATMRNFEVTSDEFTVNRTPNKVISYSQKLINIDQSRSPVWRGGAESVLAASILSVLLSCTLLNSWILMAPRGCCCFLTAVGEMQSPAGRGGGGGPGVADATVSGSVSVLLDVSSSTGVSDALSRLPPRLRRYSEGLMSELESAAVLGNLGGMKGRTNCLLTRFGAGRCSSLSSLRLGDMLGDPGLFTVK